MRQWFLVGEVQRAVAHARRHRCFANAVAALERSGTHNTQARELRLLWAAHLEKSGDLLAATEVLWPLRHQLTARLVRVLDQGLEARGPDVTSLVARRLLVEAELQAAPSAPARQLFDEIIVDDAPGAAAARSRLAFAVGTPPPSLLPLSSKLLRALFVDAAAGHSPSSLRLLAERLADPVLRADLPPLSSTPAQRPRPAIVLLDGPPGVEPARDVALLPGGRLLVARGEAGALVVTRNGKVAFSSKEPCERLVLGDSGDRALLVARRGEVLRLARLDVVSGASGHWLDVRASEIAAIHDGDLVFLVRERELFALDLLSDRASVMWQSSFRLPVRAIGRDRDQVAALWLDEDEARVSLYSSTNLGHVGERVVATPLGGVPAVVVSPTADVVGAAAMQHATINPHAAFTLQAPPAATCAPPLVVTRELAAVSYRGDDDGGGVVCHHRAYPPILLPLADGTPTALFANGTTLVVADSRGRAFVVDLATGDVNARFALP